MLDTARLDRILDTFSREVNQLGVRERLLAHRLMSGLAEHAIHFESGPQTRSMLGALLAKSVAARKSFDELFDAEFAETARLQSTPVNSETAVPSRPGRGQHWPWVVGLIAVGLAGALGLAYLPTLLAAEKPTNSDEISTEESPVGNEESPPEPIKRAASVEPSVEDEDLEKALSTLVRLRATMDEDGLATIYQIAERLADDEDARFPAETYAAAFVDRLKTEPDQLIGAREEEIVGLRATLLDLEGEMSLAKLSEIEQATAPDDPSSTIPAEAAAAKAQRVHAALSVDGGGLVLNVALSAVANEPDIPTRPLVDQENLLRELLRTEPGDVADQVSRETLDRALEAASIEADRRTLIPNASWRTGNHFSETPLAPDWAPPLALALPLAIGGLGLLGARARRRHYLQRRAARYNPVVSSLDVRAPAIVRATSHQAAKVAQGLQVRLPQTTRRLDVRASANRTARGGGVFAPVFAERRAAPDYVVLIERTGHGDHVALRLDALLQTLRAQDVSIERYFYVRDPRRLEREMDGPSISLTEVAVHAAGRRLIILGEGRSFIDPETGRLADWGRPLREFDSRALLTPKPVSAWGRLEYDLANALSMPIGRADISGLAAFAKGLADQAEGLDVAEVRLLEAYKPETNPSPSTLLERPLMWLSEMPPESAEVDAMLLALEAHLGETGMDWLGALAIYPAIQWDLTLYVGLTVSDRQGASLYDETLIVRLSHLPWLREARMPAWLRRRLVRGLHPVVRANTMAALWRLLRGEEFEAVNAVSVRLKIGRDQAAKVKGYARPLDDQVFLDAAVNERDPELALRAPGNIDAPKHGLLRDMDWPTVRVVAFTTVIGIAAWFLTPKGGEALSPGAWTPVLGLAAGLLAVWTGGAFLRVLTGDARQPLISWLARIRMFASLGLFRSQWPGRSTEGGSATDEDTSGRVFISHASADVEPVRQITAILGRAGLSLWPTSAPMHASADGIRNIARAIKEADVLLILLSKAAFETAHFKREFYLALQHKKPILPIQVEDQLSGSEDFQYLLAGVQIHKLSDLIESGSLVQEVRLLLEKSRREHTTRSRADGG